MIFDEFLTSRKESLILCAFTVLTDNVKLSVVINNAFIGARIESNLLAYLCYLS